MQQVKIGDKVKLAHHWLRNGQVGEIMDFDEKKDRWLVRFKVGYPGGGIELGTSLWLNTNDFVQLPEPL